MYIAICALLPLIGGPISALIRFRGERARNLYLMGVTLITSISVFVCAFALPPDTLRLFKLSQNFVCLFGVDGLSRFFLCLVGALWPLALLYAFEYMRHEERTGNFFVFYTMAYGVTLLLASSRNLFTLYIFFECLTVVTLPLVEHGQNKEAYRAGRAYLMYLIGGTSLGFAAMVIVHCMAGSEAVFTYGGLGTEGPLTLKRVAFILAFIGFGVKAAVFPLSRWLPKASVAPTPVTALLHAVAVVNAGVYSVARAVYYVFDCRDIAGSYAQYAPMLLASATVLYGAVRALRETHLKRRLAWSTVSNLGYMLFALSLLSQSALTAALCHMLFHSLMKIALFFAAGAVMVKSGRTDIHEMRGLAKYMPFTFFAFTLSGAALTGVPPLCGFTSKYLIITSALEGAGAFELIGIGCLIASAILTAFYIFTCAVPAYFAPPGGGKMKKIDMGPQMKISVGAVLLAILAVSLFADRIIALLGHLQEAL